MQGKIKIDVLALQNYIAQYKATFAEHRLGTDYEIYKWKAVKCFQDNWNIDALDFPTMLKNSLAKTNNLLSATNYFPKKMIEMFADAQPDTVRSMFRSLFDETRDVATRVEEFESGAAKLLESYPTLKSTFQNPYSISTYLWLRYPDKYYIYKYSVIKSNAQKLYHMDLPTGKLDRMLFGFNLYNAICDELSKDEELILISKQSLTEDCYPDRSLKTLTMDVGYFISKHEIIIDKTKKENMPKNIILYGTPGTGKTYSSVHYAVAIIEEKPLTEVKSEEYKDVFNRYLKYKKDGLIVFTTFHQSFGYEEFIEGIRPVVVSGDSADTGCDIEYEVHAGIFKSFCDRAKTSLSSGIDDNLGISKNPTVWKVSLEGTGDNPTRTECMNNNHIRIGWDEYGEIISDNVDYSKIGGKKVLNAFYNGMQIGDIVMSCYSSRTIDAIGVITGYPEWHDEYPHYKRLRNVKWLVKGINEDIVEANDGKVMTLSSVYRLSMSVSDVLQILQKVNPTLFKQRVKIPNHVFIIDEINRGNISKIFGELITLIEPSKRIGASEELRTVLPYSGRNFGVPDNVYIIGTMNTADRSIAMIDTALRRRFSFVEMCPDSRLLADILIDGIDIAEMLDTLNKRIAVLLDREHTIGHSYLLPLKSNPVLDNLAEIFENKIIPLLQEYFYDDYEKIQLVLGDNQKPDDSTRFIIKKTDVAKLFGSADIDFPEYYEINREAFKRIDAYAFLR